MIQKSQLPEVTVQATIDIDNQQLKKNSTITEVFVEALLDIPEATKSSYSAINFEPVKNERPKDLHLYIHAQCPSLIREIQLKEGAKEDEALLNLDKFLCDLQNALYADYVRINCSEGTIIYQCVGETEIKKIDITKIADGKYLSRFHKIQDALTEVIDESERVEYIERKPGLRGIDQTDQFSPPLTERFPTLHQLIIPRLLKTIKSEPEKVKFLEKVIFIDSLLEELLERSENNMKHALWTFQQVQETPSDPRFALREQELQGAKKDYELLKQLDLAALYTMAAYTQGTDSKNHIAAAHEIEKFLSATLATTGKKSWQHQESFLKKSLSWITRNRVWAELQPLTEEESDYAYRMGALSLPAGDRILYKEYIKESEKEVVDMPVLQVFIEAIRHFPDNTLDECKDLLSQTPYNFLGIQEVFQESKKAALNASDRYHTSEELLQHIKADSITNAEKETA